MALRWLGPGAGVVHLYCVPAGKQVFFAEVGVTDLTEGLVVLRSFSEAKPLEDYAHYVQLPG